MARDVKRYILADFRFLCNLFQVFVDESILRGDSGIADIVADENAPVEYFNLQGIRVENPENGLYIRRQGNKVSKVIIR